MRTLFLAFLVSSASAFAAISDIPGLPKVDAHTVTEICVAYLLDAPLEVDVVKEGQAKVVRPDKRYFGTDAEAVVLTGDVVDKITGVHTIYFIPVSLAELQNDPQYISFNESEVHTVGISKLEYGPTMHSLVTEDFLGFLTVKIKIDARNVHTIDVIRFQSKEP